MLGSSYGCRLEGVSGLGRVRDAHAHERGRPPLVCRPECPNPGYDGARLLMSSFLFAVPITARAIQANIPAYRRQIGFRMVERFRRRWYGLLWIQSRF